jgi:hypothetical protein
VFRMFERHDYCPHTEACDSFQTICRVESQTEKKLRRFMRSGDEGHALDNEGSTIHSLQRQMEHVRRVKERCYSHCQRCLRFRQFEAKAEKPAPKQPGITRPSDTIDEETLVETP